MSRDTFQVLGAGNGGGNVASWEVSCGPDITMQVFPWSLWLAGSVAWKVMSCHFKVTPSWSFRPSGNEDNKTTYLEYVVSDNFLQG